MPPTEIPQVLLLVETSRVFGRAIMEGIGQYVRERGPWSTYFEERGLDDPPPDWLKGWRGHGIIARTRSRAVAAQLHATRLPVVELHGAPESAQPHIYPDEEAIGRMAAEHLLDRGLRRLGFFAADETWWIKLRREGFVRALAEHGMSCDSCPGPSRRTSQESRWQREEEERIAAWVRSMEKPAGVFCATDRYALRLLNVCRVLNVAVPEQVAVLGIDNDPVICGLSFPPLSSIEHNPRRIGYEAAELLARMMAGERPPKKVILVPPSHVVVRQSTGGLAIDDSDVAQAVRFIREHACRQITVEQVAQAVSLSRRALERRFRVCLQRSPKREIARVQMERAKLLLHDPRISVAAVARQAGFASMSHFIKAFHRESGMTPRQFRGAVRMAGPL
jgi:LacI family transcriptional regulator